jgi:hypothetical protein
MTTSSRHSLAAALAVTARDGLFLRAQRRGRARAAFGREPVGFDLWRAAAHAGSEPAPTPRPRAWA